MAAESTERPPGWSTRPGGGSAPAAKGRNKNRLVMSEHETTAAQEEPRHRRGPLYQGNARLTLYVALVVAVGTALLVVQGGFGGLVSWAFLLWLVFCVTAELLWLETPTGEATDSMASAFNVAVLYLFGNQLSLWIIGLSVLIATRYIQKRDWIKSIFGFGQMVITAFLAGSAFRLLAGGAGRLEHFSSIGGGAGLLICCVVYFAANTALVAGAVSLERRVGFWATLKENYLYRNALTSSGALFALSPILLLSYLAIGYPGVLLFFLPLVIVKNQNRAYIELQRTTEALISSAKMAAKGEMASSIAHEMNNYIAVLSGRTELLQRRFKKHDLTDFLKDTEIIWKQIERLSRLAKGLLQFSGGQPQVTQFDLNGLCQETVEFLQPQNLFDHYKLELDLDPSIGTVQADQSQIQQIILNLCRNSAQAMGEAERPQGRIIVRTSTGKGAVHVDIEDDGPGIPEELRARIFEPGFTTKKDGHGYGLATCFRIMENHKGRIWVEEGAEGGAKFILAIPHDRAKRRESASKAA
ncbi:MAG: hypothetical protein GF346_07180 [Candidatus Eisenbacteria bacterium]|nr:hypothetical protein [Candidatus Latescibacterota bacterium]MBD3302213.1 hypothetical protein [Candidatus Eisenbacteria bacterium]